LFSNTIAPPVVAASLKALELLSASTELRDKLEENTKYFRAALTERGLTIKPGVHPIVPIMIGDAAKSQKFAARMLEKGVYVIGFFYPVVPARHLHVSAHKCPQRTPARIWTLQSMRSRK
jgi:glycine C-acetyltransferase